MPPTLHFERTAESLSILKRMDEVAGVITPGAAHHGSGGSETMAEYLAHILPFRAAYVLPAEAELKRQREAIAFDKRAREGKLKPGEIIGPPDPRKGRGRLR